MSSKHFYLIGIILVAAIVTIAYQTKQNSQISSIYFANIEALSSSENIYIQLCNDLCVDSPKDVCSHTTAAGYSINCIDMNKKPE